MSTQQPQAMSRARGGRPEAFHLTPVPPSWRQLQCPSMEIGGASVYTRQGATAAVEAGQKQNQADNTDTNPSTNLDLNQPKLPIFRVLNLESRRVVSNP